MRDKFILLEVKLPGDPWLRNVETYIQKALALMVLLIERLIWVGIGKRCKGKEIHEIVHLGLS